jgi:uncharacterized protein YceK
MNQIILMMVACALFSGCASTRALSTSEKQIQKIVEVKGASKNQLFDKSKMWFASTFKSANAVIQYENKENGTIMGNGNITTSITTVLWRLKFSIATEVKDEKARITITGTSVSAADRDNEWPVSPWYWDSFKNELESLSTEYELFLKDKTESQPGNW